MENDSKEGVVLSGMRPTGQLHIGHFEAVLQNWVKLQETHDCFYFVADWHATTTEESTAGIPDFAIDNVADWLAFGIEPDKSTVFVQSHVPEHFELAAHLLPLVNYGRLVRMPTFKGFVDHIAGDRVFRDDDRILEGDERLEAAAKRDITSAFVVYPVIQAADILIYDTTHVPVGEDQVPHVELTRDLAGAFNRRYGDIFVVPEADLMEIPRIRGYDGRKMSKSFDNDINPGDDLDTITNRIKKTITVRPTLDTKGDPFECPVYDLHRIFNKEGEAETQLGCVNATSRCYDCKMELPERIADAYADYRTKRAEISNDDVVDILREGNLKAREVAKKKMEQVRSFMKLDYAK